MDCLSESRIIEYLENELNPLEKRIVDDHLIGCGKCQQRVGIYSNMDLLLREPILDEPPREIASHVIRKLFPYYVSYPAILLLMTACFLVMISCIYVYFDFANNSIMKAVQETSTYAASWLASVIKTVSAVFSFVYAIYLTLNAVIQAIFKINLGADVIGALLSSMILGIFFLVYRIVHKRVGRAAK